MADRVAVRGTWGTVEWALNERGRMPAHEFFESIGDGDQAKALALFRRLADAGKITNPEKFKKLDAIRGQHLFEFKSSSQIRLLGAFRPGCRFIVAHGVIKKQDRHSARDLETAARILSEHDEWGLT